MPVKYEITSDALVVESRTLHAIRRLSDGAPGGWIEKELNLSDSGSAWIFPGAMVYGDAQVYDDAVVYDKATVRENAIVCGNASVRGTSTVCGSAWVSGNALISNNALISGDARVYGNASVGGNTVISGNANICHAGDYISLLGLPFDITVWEDTVQIGQECIPISDWISIESELGDRVPYNEFRRVRKLILHILSFYKEKPRKASD